MMATREQMLADIKAALAPLEALESRDAVADFLRAGGHLGCRRRGGKCPVYTHLTSVVPVEYEPWVFRYGVEFGQRETFGKYEFAGSCISDFIAAFDEDGAYPDLDIDHVEIAT